MVKAKALQAIKQNGIVCGYRLQDEKGTILDVKKEMIINAINSNKINICNLTINSSGDLVIVDSKSDNTENNKVKQVNSRSETPKSEVNKDSNNSKINRMQQLIMTLNNATKVYEQGKDEIMSNKEWDKLYDELLNLEKETNTVLANSPTQKVGYEIVSSLPKERHETPMLSLEKTKSRTDLANFLKDKEGVLSCKLDGLTVVLTYDNGKLIKGVTRGNGEVGEVVTPNVKQFINVPKNIAFANKLVLRGEAIIRYSTFEKINSAIVSADEKYKNPRNLCSGSVRQLNSEITAKRKVEWLCFEVVECQGMNLSNDIVKQFEFVRSLGFSVVDYSVVDSNTINGAIINFEKSITNGYDIPTDGLVLTFRDKKYGESLGRTAKSPRHSKAFKWRDETAVTNLRYIDWSASRTGLINPVAVFDPVDIEGSTISRASVHNLSILRELELGIGDSIEVYKANMIIPQISANLTRSDNCEIPSECPVCGGPTSIHQDPMSGVYTLWCENPNCLAKGHKLLEHFVSRDAMNIVGISESKLERLMAEGIISTPSSLYNIKNFGYEITSMEGFGDTSFYNMVEAIEKSKDVKLSNFVYALGIPNIGLSTSKLICSYFGYDVSKVVNASFDELLNIDGIGEVIASSFVNYFSDSDNQKEFMDIYKNLRIIPEKVSNNTTMKGVTICVTGDVYRFSSRRQLKEAVENLGGKVTGSVSKSTTYLVTNDTTTGSNKNKKAQEYGIRILTEDEFIKLFNLTV